MDIPSGNAKVYQNKNSEETNSNKPLKDMQPHNRPNNNTQENGGNSLGPKTRNTNRRFKCIGGA